MPRLFWGNFEFEHTLGKTPVGQLSRVLREVNATWTVALVSLLEPGDYLWIPELLIEKTDCWQEPLEQAGGIGIWQVDQIPDNTEIEFVPWGWTEKNIRWANEQGWITRHPELSIVAWANSRATSFQYEKEWGTVLPGATELVEVEDLARTLERYSADDRWVIKAEFSMSARERVIGRGREISTPIRNWLNKRLQNGGRVFFEPWVDRIDEMSFHYDLSPAGDIRFWGMTKLHSDPFGRYLGNSPVSETDLSETEKWECSRTKTGQLACQFAQKGYFGPLSIDAMRYYNKEGICTERPLQDINARYSMGRCALEKERKMIDGNVNPDYHVS